MWTPKLVALLAPILIEEAKYNISEEEKFFDAIWAVESGRQENPPDGDNGKAIGPYQIHRAYFQDAKDFSPTEIDFEYELCRDKHHAEIVIREYMKRYARDAWEQHNFEILARIHNGGPRGHKKKATVKYWNKVKKELNRKSS